MFVILVVKSATALILAGALIGFFSNGCLVATAP